MSYSARHLPRHTGRAGWAAIWPTPKPGPKLEGAHTADIVIIGAGFAGLSAARRAHQIDPTAKLAVLEAGTLAEGASGRNSGFMIDLPHELTSEDYAGTGDDLAIIRLNRHAQAFAADMVEDYVMDPAVFDRAGKINGAASAQAEAHNQSYAKHLNSLGETSNHLDAQMMRDITGSAHYRSGLYTPGTVLLQPAGYVQGVAAGLRRDGVQIFERSAAQRFERNGTGWRVSTPAGHVSAGQIILAINGHLESFGVAQNRLMQIFLFAVMTPVLDQDAQARLGGQARWGITPSDPMGTTVRRIDAAQGGARIVTRTCAVMRSHMQARPRDLARASRVMQSKFNARFPALKNMRMEHAWAGHLCLTRNSVSITGEIDEGVISACAQNGLGTARGTLTGIAAAECALGQRSDVTAHFAAEPHPSHLPPRPIRDIGANTVLRLREWRAGDE